MKKLVTIGAIAALSGTASGGVSVDEFECAPWFADQHSIAYGDDPVGTRSLQFTPNDNFIYKLRIVIQYDEVDAFGNPFPDPTSWASHLGLIAELDGVRYGFGGTARNLGALAGGYSGATAMAATDFYDIWDFNGAVSDLPGEYVHEYYFDPMVPKPEMLNVYFTDTWNGNALYTQLTLQFSKIPTPGSAGLMVIAGLTAARRRR